MRIAQVAPLHESVPPVTYGGTERVVHHLTEELVELGHDVTLFASGDSKTSAKLISPCVRALRLDGACVDTLAPHLVLLDMLVQERHRFDVVHFHIDYLHFLVSRELRWKQLTTLHGRLDISELQPVYDRFGSMPVVSISDAQRAPLPQANWLGTVHHGLRPEQFRFSPQPADYFAFLGRISPEKRLDRAIQIATTLDVPLKVAAKVDKVDQHYFETRIANLMKSELVQFIGEIGEHEKSTFLGGARALLFPIDWPEPFGLVMIEAMACGTPVIAFNTGSVPEVIEDGVTGFIVQDLSSAVEAAGRVDSLDRGRVRQAFEERFAARRMAEEYLKLYEVLVRHPNLGRVPFRDRAA